MARLIRSAQVAAKLCLSVETFHRRRASLRAAGFPEPCPPFRDRWSETVVDAWIDAAHAPAPPAASPRSDAVEDWKATLKHRAAAQTGA